MAFCKIKIESIIKSRQGRKIKKKTQEERSRVSWKCAWESGKGQQAQTEERQRVIGHVQVNTTAPPCRSVQFASHRNETQAQQLRLNVLPEKRARWQRETHTDHFLSPDWLKKTFRMSVSSESQWPCVIKMTKVWPKWDHTPNLKDKLRFYGASQCPKNKTTHCTFTVFPQFSIFCCNYITEIMWHILIKLNI